MIGSLIRYADHLGIVTNVEETSISEMSMVRIYWFGLTKYIDWPMMETKIHTICKVEYAKRK